MEPEIPNNENDKLKEQKLRAKTFRDTVYSFNQASQEQDEGYKQVFNDPIYKNLLESGDFAIHFEFHEDLSYRFRRGVNLERPGNDTDPNFPSINWRKVKNKVYLKEFIGFEEQQKAKKKQASKGLAAVEDTKKDFEVLIGENLFNKIGGAILVLGVLLLVKFLASKGIIGPYFRLFLGFATSILLFALSFNALKKFKTVSTVLVTIALIIFFYTTELGYEDYHLLSEYTVLILDFLATITAITLSGYFNKVELSIISLTLSYLVPIIFKQWSDEALFYFGYLFFLNIITLTLAYIKKWKVLNTIIFYATLSSFGYWVATTEFDEYTALRTLVLSLGFYLCFFMMSIAYSLRSDITYSKQDRNINFINTAFFFFLGIYLMNQLGIGNLFGLFAGIIAIINVAYAYLTYGHKHLDYDLFYSLVGLVTFFISIIVPLEFEWQYTPLVLAIESFVLMWFFTKTNYNLFRDISLVVSLLSVAFLIVLWTIEFNDDNISPFFNYGFLSSVFISTGLILCLVQTKSIADKEKIIFLTYEKYKSLFVILVIGILYLGFIFEFNIFDEIIFPNTAVKTLIINNFNLIFVLIVRGIGNLVKVKFIKKAGGIILGAMALSYIGYGHFSTVFLRDQYIYHGAPGVYFYIHYINLALTILVVYVLARDILTSDSFAKVGKYAIALWVMGFLGIFHVTAEFDHYSIILFPTDLNPFAQTIWKSKYAGYTFIWCLLALLYMYIGLKLKVQEIRKIALVLLIVTLVKFFILDFMQFEALGRILALIIVGAFLLLVSMMYKNIQKIVLEGEIDLQNISFMQGTKYGSSEKSEQSNLKNSKVDIPDSEIDDIFEDKNPT